MSTPNLPPAHPDSYPCSSSRLRVRHRYGDYEYARARDKTYLLRSGDRVSEVSYARARGRREAGRVVPSAAGLLTAAARVLPAADRSRYGEEYRSELWDLARSGAGPLRQLRYALRQLRGALPAGCALRSARRRSAAR